MIRFECPGCGQPVEVEDAFAGHRGRCPDCGRVVDIPGRSPGPEPLGEEAPPPAESAFTDEAGGRGPRRLTLPESVTSVVARAPGETAPRPAWRSMAVAGLVLGCVPPASVIGIVLAGMAYSQAPHAGARRLARAALTVAIVMTVAGFGLGLALLVAVFQDAYHREMAETCRQNLATVHGELDGYATGHGGRYPASLAELNAGGHVFYFGDEDRCPQTGERFGYVAGLAPDPAGRAIVLFDPEPAHGCRTLLWRTPPGRNVCRLSGDVEFLAEKAFQREMAAQKRPR